MSPLDDYCRPGHHCDNGILLKAQWLVAYQRWLEQDTPTDEARDHVKYRHNTYRQHVIHCEQIRP